MKLKFERFEGLSCFSIRGIIKLSDLKVLEIGLETLCKSLSETLLVNLNLAVIDDSAQSALLVIKKKLPALTKQKIYWVTKTKSIADFNAIELFTSRLSGFKSRQIGERIKLDDELHLLHDEVKAVESKVIELGGNADRTQTIILENRILKAQELILKNTIHFQMKRIKAQAKVASKDDDVHSKIEASLAELKKFYVQEIK